MNDGERLRGWKTIAAYLRVTQSTAIRWSKQPDFPVIRAGEGGSVYAYPAALDAWLARDADLVDTPPAGEAHPDPEDRPTAPAMPSSVAMHDAPLLARFAAPGTVHLAIIALIAILIVALVAVAIRPRTAPTPAASAAPEAVRLLRDARAEWAARTPESLARATTLFQALVGRFPDFPPGFTGLADAYILSCEFAPNARPVAFAKAKAAASTALALAPDDGDAQRIMGFLTYWTTRDMARAAPFFKQAMDSGRAGYLAPLWYGNALIDAGRVAEGLAMVERALEIAPDSPAVLTNYGVALWQNGAADRAMAILARVEQRYPEHSSAPGMAALFALSRGDVATYLDSSARWARLIGDPRQVARVTHEQTAYRTGAGPAVLRTIAYAPPLDSPFWHGGLLPAAIAASLSNDRPRLIAILGSKTVQHQNWRRLRFPMAAFARWRGDPDVTGRLARLVGGPPFDPPTTG